MDDGPPGGPLAGCTILIAYPDAFVAHYLEVALCRAGARILGPVASAEAVAELLAREPVSGCAAGASLAPAALAAVGRFSPGLPIVFVLGEACGGRQDVGLTIQLAPPFAAYQIVDALAGLCSRPAAAEPDAAPAARLA